MYIRVILPGVELDGVDAIAGENAASCQETPVLPVREAELRAAERILAVHPPGEPVPDERRVDLPQESLVRGRIFADQRCHKERTLGVEQADALAQIGDGNHRDFRCLLPFPLVSELVGRPDSGE